MLFRNSLAQCQRALKGWKGLPWVRWSGVVFAPAVVDQPTPVDSTLFAVVAGLAVVAGVSVGVVYRYLHGKNDDLGERASDAEAELKTLLTVTDDAILVLDGTGVIRAANPGAEEFFSRNADDLCGMEMAEVITQRYALAEATRHGPASFETFASRPGESSVPVEIVLSPVELARGRRYLLLTRPRTGGQTMADIGKPIAKLCHELNNHLTGVTGNLSLMLMTGSPDSTTRERVTNAKRSMLKAQETVRKVQAFAKGEESAVSTPPAPSPTIVPMPPAPAAPAPSSDTPRILVLEDEPAIGSLVCGALQTLGYDAVYKDDAQDAIEACEEAVKTGRRFDLVISDLSLPGELDGHKAVARMRTIDADLKSIVTSGYNHDPIMLDYREHGFSGAIAKPYDMGQLLRLVRDVLSGVEKPNRRTA